MTITDTFVWSASVSVEVPDNASPEEQREALDNEALKAELDFSHPILYKCSNEELID